MSTLSEVKIEDIKFSPFNARKEFAKDKLQELADSIKEKGVIEPIIVRKAKDGGVEVICGERRVRASKLAGLSTIPAILKELDDKQALEFQVIENLQREDLNPIDEACGYEAMVRDMGYTQKSLADKVGKNLTYIKQRMVLLGLEEEYRLAIRKGEILAAHGQILLRLGDLKERADLFKNIIKDKLTISEAASQLQSYTCYLDRIKFDKTECAKCQFNGASQPDLFKDPNYLKGYCLNKICFNKKKTDMINKELQKLRDKGLNVVSDKKLIKEMQVFRYGEKPLKKCQGCKNLFCNLSMQWDGDFELTQLCNDKNCFAKTIKHTDPEKEQAKNEAEKQKDVQERADSEFLKKELPSKMTETQLLMVYIRENCLFDEAKVIKLKKEQLIKILCDEAKEVVKEEGIFSTSGDLLIKFAKDLGLKPPKVKENVEKVKEVKK